MADDAKRTEANCPGHVGGAVAKSQIDAGMLDRSTHVTKFVCDDDDIAKWAVAAKLKLHRLACVDVVDGLSIRGVGRCWTHRDEDTPHEGATECVGGGGRHAAAVHRFGNQVATDDGAYRDPTLFGDRANQSCTACWCRGLKYVRCESHGWRVSRVALAISFATLVAWDRRALRLAPQGLPTNPRNELL